MKERRIAKWISYPGDHEIMLLNKLNMRRRDRELIMPPIWHMCEVYSCVKFARRFTLSAPDEIRIEADGRYNVELDIPGNYLHGDTSVLRLEAGEHSLTVSVFNDRTLPALRVTGSGIVSDGSWQCTAFDGIWKNAAETNGWRAPGAFRLPRRAVAYECVREENGGLLYDFGKEIFGALFFTGVTGSGTINIFYGESEREALDPAHCETLDVISVKGNKTARAEDARGFRYALIRTQGVRYGALGCQIEYASHPRAASFSSADRRLTEIWNTSLYTMELTAREFYIDGIKRDRWVWMGDTAQSVMMNWYSYYETEIVRRTLTALGGKGEVTQHMNTINDYTLFWFSALLDYCEHTGDEAFLRSIYGRALAYMSFIRSRLNEDGMMEGLEGDWVFVDWADGLVKEGTLSYLQILLWRAYVSMAEIARVAGDRGEEQSYLRRATALKDAVNRKFWDEGRGAFAWSEEKTFFRQPSVIAVVTGFADGAQKKRIRAFLKDDGVPPIVTPYMRFYELSALAELGEREYVLGEIRSYWGGMLDRGATSFWERYDPAEEGDACLSMYDRPYGKSLCHAWGASPLYLLGKYFVGLTMSPRSFTLCPAPELPDFSARYPLSRGTLTVRSYGGEIAVSSSALDGKLILPDGKEYEIKRGKAYVFPQRK